MKIAGWVMSVLTTALLLFSASNKLMDWEGKEKQLAEMGLTLELTFTIGILEAILALLLIVPRAGFIAAILFTGYFGGAVLTHLRLGDGMFFGPIIVAVFMWIAVGLRMPQVFALAIGSTTNSPKE